MSITGSSISKRRPKKGRVAGYVFPIQRFLNEGKTALMSPWNAGRERFISREAPTPIYDMLEMEPDPTTDDI